MIVLITMIGTSSAFLGRVPSPYSRIQNINQNENNHVSSDSTVLKSAVVLDEKDWFKSPSRSSVAVPQVKQRRQPASSASNQVKGNAGSAGASRRLVALQTKIQSMEQFQEYIRAQSASSSSGRYTVVKFHASWCKTCAKFGLKYDKLVSQHSDWVVRPPKNVQQAQFDEDSLSVHRQGDLRFASVDYSSNPEIFEALNVKRLPTVHIYDPRGNKVVDIQCPPSLFQELADKVKMYVAKSKDVPIDVKETTSSRSKGGVSFIPKGTLSFVPARTSPSSVATAVTKKSSDDDLQSFLYAEAAFAAMQVSYRSRSFAEGTSDETDTFLSSVSRQELGINGTNSSKQPWWRRLPKFVQLTRL